MLAFIGGLFVGGFFGVVIMCILSVAGQTETYSKEDENIAQNEDHSKSLRRD